MEVWKSQSNYGKQLTLSLGCLVVGLVLMGAFRDFHGSGNNALAGFALGGLLFGLGVWNVLVNGKQTVVVEPVSRRILVEDFCLFASKRRAISFAEVGSVGIGYLGKKSNGVTWYYLVLKLTNGEEYALFAPGRCYEGGSDRAVVASWRRRLEEYLGRQGGG